LVLILLFIYKQLIYYLSIMPDFIEDFLNNLEEDKSKFSEGFGDRIKKLYFSFEDNHGILIFAPFIDKLAHRPYILLQGVKEYKAPCSKYKGGDEATWMRILPKQAYGQLTDEQSKLYDEVVSLWDQVNNEIGESDDAFTQIRVKTYSLFQGIILKQNASNGKAIEDNINKAALLIYPGKSVVNALSSAIESKIATMGTKEWITAIFSPDANNRDGVISITFNKKTGGGFGYEATVGFEMNSNWTKVIDPTKFEQAEIEKLGGVVPTFLGWQSADDEHPFDSKVFEELSGVLKLKLKSIDNPTPAPNAEPAPKNMNGVDPMVGKVETPTEAPTTTAPGGVKYPF
jgi:hypothetical protein